jgi:hypothetical protein
MEMTRQRFWVIGGDYAGMDFKQLKSGAEQILGPFDDREEATAAWKRVSAEHRSRATARFSIASEQISLPG